jgi:Cys-tRNA(Pro)/Cys-tRNA(Cys) deacylase
MAATRAIVNLRKAKLPFEIHTYAYDPAAADIGMFAATALGVPPNILLKTLMVQTPAGAMIALVPCDRQLDLKGFAAAAKIKSCTLMQKSEAERISGYVIGGISPIGQKKTLPTFIDASVQNENWVMCNGGQRGVQVKLAPEHLMQICQAKSAPLSSAPPAD